jgi:peptidoglycan/LPS O-acetylase OafA/YrhL
MSDEPQAPAASLPKGNWRLDDTHLMRAAAILLICNSHLKDYYPRPWMGADGLLGNSFFFFLSGFGIALASSRKLGFFAWFKRRVVRIYPTVFLGVLLLEFPLHPGSRSVDPMNLLELFIWPTPYYYITLIMLIYIVLYWVLLPRSRLPHVAAIAGAFGACAMVFAYDFRHMQPHQPLVLGTLGWVHNFYFTGVALLGALAAPMTRRPGRTLGKDVAIFLAILAVYLAAKFIMDHGRFVAAALSLHAMVVAMCFLVLRISASDQTHDFLGRIRPLGIAISALAAWTLAIYVTQGYVWPHPEIAGLRHPLNIGVFWMLTLCGAFLLYHLAAALSAVFGARKTPAAPPMAPAQ